MSEALSFTFTGPDGYHVSVSGALQSAELDAFSQEFAGDLPTGLDTAQAVADLGSNDPTVPLPLVALPIEEVKATPQADALAPVAIERSTNTNNTNNKKRNTTLLVCGAAMVAAAALGPISSHDSPELHGGATGTSAVPVAQAPTGDTHAPKTITVHSYARPLHISPQVERDPSPKTPHHSVLLSAPRPPRATDTDVCNPGMEYAYAKLTGSTINTATGPVHLSPEAAAAVLGNVMVESPRAVPNQVEHSGKGGDDLADKPVPHKGYGLMQWTTKSRQDALVAYAKAHGQPVDSLDAQLGFALEELKTLPEYAEVWRALTNPNYRFSPPLPGSRENQLAQLIMAKYEAPKEHAMGGPNARGRGAHADEIGSTILNCYHA
jgi:hypothetical protein